MRFFYISQSCIHILSKVFWSTSKQLTQDVSWIRFGQEFKQVIRTSEISNRHLGTREIVLKEVLCSIRDLIRQCGVSLQRMLNDILILDQLQWHPPPISSSINFMTLIPNLTFTELRVVSMKRLQRVWHASRACLPFRPPGSVPHFGTWHHSLSIFKDIQNYPNWPCSVGPQSLCNRLFEAFLSCYVAFCIFLWL